MAVAVLVVVSLCGCRQQRTDDENWLDVLATYQQRGQQGDCKAYLEGAEYCLTVSDVECGTIMAGAMAYLAEYCGAIGSWKEWAMGQPKNSPVHIMVTAMEDLSVERYDDAMKKGELLAQMGFHKDLAQLAISVDKDKSTALALSQQMMQDGSLIGRLLYCAVSDDVHEIVAVAEEYPVILEMMQKNGLDINVADTTVIDIHVADTAYQEMEEEGNIIQIE